MKEQLPIEGISSDSGSILQTLLNVVSKEGGLKTALVVLALVCMLYMARWVIKRSSVLYEEHDRLRESLVEDGTILRNEVRALLEDLSTIRLEMKEKDARIFYLEERELCARQKIIEMGVNPEDIFGQKVD